MACEDLRSTRIDALGFTASFKKSGLKQMSRKASGRERVFSSNAKRCQKRLAQRIHKPSSGVEGLEKSAATIFCPTKNVSFTGPVQSSAYRWAPGLVNFVHAVAYHFCLALPVAFTQPGVRLLAEPCRTICVIKYEFNGVQ